MVFAVGVYDSHSKERLDNLLDGLMITTTYMILLKHEFENYKIHLFLEWSWLKLSLQWSGYFGNTDIQLKVYKKFIGGLVKKICS